MVSNQIPISLTVFHLVGLYWDKYTPIKEFNLPFCVGLKQLWSQKKKKKKSTESVTKMCYA